MATSVVAAMRFHCVTSLPGVWAGAADAPITPTAASAASAASAHEVSLSRDAGALSETRETAETERRPAVRAFSPVRSEGFYDG